MEARFNVTKEDRKALVAAVSEITNVKAEYQGAPSFAFAVGGSIIDKNGTVTFDGQMSVEDIRSLQTALAERGFTFEGDIDEIAPAAGHAGATPDDLTECEVIAGESDSGSPAPREVSSEDDTIIESKTGGVSVIETPDTLVVEVPLVGFTRTALDNLDKMVASKVELIMKAIGLPPSDGTDDLPIEQTESTLRFPWFPLPASKDVIDAYGMFVCALCELAKKQKRVTMKDADVDSEKFAMRCFLLRLGFIGDEYKSARRILLSKLSGSGSFKSGDHKKTAAPVTVMAADNSVENEDGSNTGDGEQSANIAATGGKLVAPSRCGECWNHSYYTDGLLRTKAGDVVDTSKRMPEKYTHYCLGAPSGFRKIKSASDWSGCENPPAWCPLNTK